ncbi:MAG: magnesium transporter [Candidatus Aenigmatarchaeota archaeon]|nr:magnesium transporter [Nanoarchaeota archaeon]
MIYTFGGIIKESVPVLILSALIAIGAGLVLSSSEHLISAIPGIIIMIPAFINMNGSLMSVLASRLSSALHMGLIHPKLHRTKTLDRNIISVVIISLVSFLFLGFTGGFLMMLLGLGTINLFFMGIMILVAGMITTTILIFFTVIMSYYLFKKGDDPDNWVIPILTSGSDFIGIILLLLFVGFAI